VSAGARLLLAVAAGVVLVAGTTAAFAAVAVMRDGTVAVDVRQDGSQVSVAIPASIVRAALTVVPRIASRDMDAAMSELRPHWPLLRAACDELASCPDGVLVEVEGAGERVLVAKERGDLVVRVRAGGDRVDVRIPASTVPEAAAAFGRMSGLD
jgi:hypothetical protein